MSAAKKLSKTLFAFDLDGTLVHPLPNGKRGIPNELIECLDELSKRHQIVIATGRRYRTAKIFSEKLPKIPFLICNNGMVIRNEVGEIWHKENADWESVQKISALVEQTEHDPILVLDGGREEIDFATTKRFRDKARVAGELISKHQDSILHLNSYLDLEELFHPHLLEVAVMARLEELRLLKEQSEALLPKGFRAITIENCGYGIYSIMELLREGCSKWSGIQKVASDLGCTETVAIGDDENDMEMLEFSTHGVVMSHARDHIKKVANRAVDGPRGLEAYLRKEWL